MEQQREQQLTACAALGRQDSERSLNCKSLCVDAISSLAALARSSRLACHAGGSRRRNACWQGHDSEGPFRPVSCNGLEGGHTTAGLNSSRRDSKWGVRSGSSGGQGSSAVTARYANGLC